MSLVNYEIRERIGFLTLNRPEKKNALSHELIEELKLSFLTAEHDSRIKILVLKANGNTFCSGADLGNLQKLQQNTFEENLADSNHLRELYYLIYNLRKVVICQVNGSALAGGCGLVSVCDFSFAVPEAKFGYTEVRIGFVPALVSTFLIRKIGEAKARQLLLSGDLIDAGTAKEINLINDVVNEQDIGETVYEFATRLCKRNSGQAMAMTKNLISEVQNKGLEEALIFSAELNAKAREGDDCKKGIEAFLNKENLIW